MWADPYGRFFPGDLPETAGMTSPVRCRCGHVYDLGTVTVEARYTDCSMWRTPCCRQLADDRKPPWGISWYTELPRTDITYPVDDDDVTFPEEN